MDLSGVWWIGTPHGLLRWTPGHQARPVVPSLAIKQPQSLGLAGNSLGIVWHSLPSEALSPGEKEETSLLEVPLTPRRDLSDAVTLLEPAAYPASGSPAAISWRFDNSLRLSELVDMALVADCEPGKRRPLRDPQQNVDTWSAVYTVPAVTGQCKLQIEVEDLWGRRVRTTPKTVDIDGSPLQRIETWLTVAVKFYTGFEFLLFMVLACGAHWSRGCLRLLTHPAVRKPGLYFGLLVEFVSPLRVWLLRPYFLELKRRYGGLPEPYLPVSLSKATGETVESDQLVRKLQGARVLVRGSSGSGKTVLVRHLLDIYTRSPTLGVAWRRYGFIPIPIDLRDLAAQELPVLAKKALDGFGASLGDDKLVARLLRMRGFLLILDGLNEANLDSAVRDFAASNSATTLLLTSQSGLGSESIVELQLPAIDPKLCGKLLRTFLGDRLGQQVAAQAKDLLPQLDSGYDVRILADLADAGAPVPLDRIGLYERYLGQIPAATLKTLTRSAWECWRAGQKRQFAANDMQNAAQLAALENLMPFGTVESKPHAGQPAVSSPSDRRLAIVVRHGTTYEFRHDQLLAFLAARYLAQELPPAAAKAQLSLDTVWQATTDNQRSLYSFLAALLPSRDLVLSFTEFTIRDLEHYEILLQALQAAAMLRGWPLSIDLNPQTGLRSAISPQIKANQGSLTLTADAQSQPLPEQR